MRMVSCGSLLAGCSVLACNLAVRHAHGRAEALERNGILHVEASTLRSAAHIQALDDLAVGAVDVAFLVGLKTAQVAQGKRTTALRCVERAILQGEQTLGALAEIGVFARLRQLVVTLDGGLGSFDIHALDHAEKLFDGVGLQAATLFDCGVDIRTGANVDAQTRSGVFGQRLLTIDARNAVGGGEILQLLGPGGVEELIRLALRLKLHLILELLTGNIFVHEALAMQVQPQKSRCCQ